MFIQTEPTPNPSTLKFLPGREVAGSRVAEYRSASEAEASPLAAALFSVDGVSQVFLGNDFVSVTKGGGEWQHLKPSILGVIMEHFISGAPVFAGAEAESEAEDEFFDATDSDTVDQIKELIETRVRPAVAGDGGDIRFRGFKDGTVYLAMKGACSGCPSSTATLKHGIQNLLKHFVPEVQAVEQI
ncbi:MAG: NifU family protein [Hyphomicrobiales bacterium]|nr:NifU family protein [Hyphomicrobiales bacterium]